MIEAHDLGMTGGDYAFFGIELIKTAGSQNDFSWYKAGDRRNKIAKAAYEALFMVALRVPVSKEFDLFVLDAVKRSSEEFKKIVTKDEVCVCFPYCLFDSFEGCVKVCMICMSDGLNLDKSRPGASS